MVINVEPIPELQNPDNLVDYTSIRCLAERGFMRGCLPALQALANDGKIEILKTHRGNFGSLMIEGYSHIIWHPNIWHPNK